MQRRRQAEKREDIQGKIALKEPHCGEHDDIRTILLSTANIYRKRLRPHTRESHTSIKASLTGATNPLAIRANWKNQASIY